MADVWDIDVMKFTGNFYVESPHYKARVRDNDWSDAINAAINDAYDVQQRNKGGTVHLGGSQYPIRQPIDLAPSVSLVGRGPRSTVISLGPDPFPGRGPDFLPRMMYIGDGSHNIRVANLKLWGKKQEQDPKVECHGILVRDSSHLLFDNVTVSEIPSPRKIHGDGVSFHAGPTIGDYRQSQLVFDRTEGVIIERCRFESNDRCGVAVIGTSANLRILNSDFTNNLLHGIDVETEKIPKTREGLEWVACYALFHGNYCKYNSLSGIFVGPDNNPTEGGIATKFIISNNIVRNNGNHGIWICRRSYSVVLEGNLTCNNAGSNIVVQEVEGGVQSANFSGPPNTSCIPI